MNGWDALLCMAVASLGIVLGGQNAVQLLAEMR